MKRSVKYVATGFTFYGGLWQIWECIMALVNKWCYAFPFKLLILCEGDIYIALDFWIVVCALSFLYGVSLNEIPKRTTD